MQVHTVTARPSLKCMKRLSLLIVLFISGLRVWAQHGCTHAEQLQQLREQHPDWLPAQLARAAFLEHYTHSFDPAALPPVPAELVIPVVFHVVHDHGPENISASQIHEAIAQLNEDFSAGNPELTAVHPAFAGVVANVGFVFRLADFDPTGQPTTGINRLASSVTYNGSNLALKELIQWDPSMYLNIWVVHSSDGGNGSAFAFYPADVEGAASIYDGIVASYWAVGRTETAVSTHYKILTHEVGHWANLKHTWGDQTGNQASGGCAYDDDVEDTPNTVGNTGCSLEAVSCGSLDNVQNYMDYSTCSCMFTAGQKTRMHAALCSDVANRNHLWSAENHAAVFIEEGPLPRVVYHGSTFEESPANDGSIDSQITLELLDLTFAFSGALTEGVDFTVSHVPPGAILSIVAVDSAHAVLHLTGQVAAHAAADGLDSIGVHFTAAPFSGVELADLYNPSKPDLSLQFLDPYEVVFVDLVDDVHNFFEGQRWRWFTMGPGGADFGVFHADLDQIKLETYGNSAICQPGTRNIVPLPAGTEVGPMSAMTPPAPWYPGQLDLSNPAYTDWNGETAYAGVSFERNGFLHYGWIRLRVSEDGRHYYVLDMAYNEAPNAPLLTGEVDAPVLAYSSTVFYESEANDGSVSSARAVDLFGATWADFGVLYGGEGFSVAPLPEGLTARLERVSESQVLLSFVGAAVDHAKGDGPWPLYLTWDSAMLEGGESGMTLTQPLAIEFADPYAIVHEVVDAAAAIQIAHPGASWKWFSLGVGDADFGLWYINDHFRLETYHKSGMCLEGTTDLEALQAGDSIGEARNWEYFTELETQLVLASPDHLDWRGTSAYAGFKFTLAERFHYGWMRFAVSEAGDSVALLEYAYNLKPGEGILAGQQYADSGCMDSLALNFNPVATQDDGTCTYPIDCGNDALLTLTLHDSYGDGWNGNAWTLLDGSGAVQAALTLSAGSEGEVQFCLAPGCYLYAVGGGNYLEEISWMLHWDTVWVASGTGGEEGLAAVAADCSGLIGCTDAAAFNFNPAALQEDGSCEYPVLGCTDPFALNFDPAAEVDDGSCYDENDVLGCTDPAASNFMESATYNDGSCAYPPLSLLPMPDGICMGAPVDVLWTGGQPGAPISLILINVGLGAVAGGIAVVPNTGAYVWFAEGLTLGATYQLYIQNEPYPPTSWSYSTPFAVFETCTGCLGDFSGNGLVTVEDILMMLGEFGCSGVCLTDVNGDGHVAVDDFLLVLGAFGESCE